MKKLYLTTIFILLTVLSSISGAVAQDTDLPAKYDLRNVNGKNYVTPVKNQFLWGTCWSFASNAAAETNALLKGAPSTIDLSERSLAWFTTRMQKNQGAPDSTYEGYYTLNTEGVPQGVGAQTYAAFNNGGSSSFALNQFATWYGSNTEARAPYMNDEGLTTNDEPAIQGTWSLPYNMLYQQEVHLQNGETRFASEGPSPDGSGTIVNGQPEDFANWIKQSLLEHGGIAIFYGYDKGVNLEVPYENTEHSSYYCYNGVDVKPDHVVTVVGWDDNYPASNFSMTPPGDGAYIVKNSWGTKYGDNGYFYLSYYDQTLTSGSWFDIETPNTNGGYSYDNIYQYDFLGAKSLGNYPNLLPTMEKSGMTAGNTSYASIFTSDHKEKLDAVSAFNPVVLDQNQSVTTDVQVYVLNDNYTSPTDGELVATGTTTFDSYGIHTIKLQTPVELPKGTAFSVVETSIVTETTDSGTKQIPLLSFELGLENSSDTELQGPDGGSLGFSLTSNDAKAQPGESFIKGLNGDNWQDVTSSEVVNNSKIHYTVQTAIDGVEKPNKVVYGNALIKAYTTDLEVVPPSTKKPEVDTINLTPESTTLSTLPGNTNSVKISASFEPANAYVDIDNLQWIVTDNLSMQVDPSNQSITVTALEEGYGIVECTNGAQLGLAIINVTNQPIVAESIEVVNTSPDSFNIEFNNVGPNPAFAEKLPVDSLSVFAWSETDQSDINAKIVTSQDGSNNFVLENVPVNDTAINNYFVNADSITINAYANSGGNLYWLGSTDTSWNAGETMTASNPGNRHIFTYITYGQNVGFVKPSSFYPANPDAGEGNGVIGSDISKHLEGVRISCNVQGVDITPSVYAKGLGWIDGADGQYTGTMGENRPIEAIKLAATPNYQSSFGAVNLTYRAYIEGQGWTDYATVNTDTVLGTPESGHPILAIELGYVRLGQ